MRMPSGGERGISGARVRRWHRRSVVRMGREPARVSPSWTVRRIMGPRPRRACLGYVLLESRVHWRRPGLHERTAVRPARLWVLLADASRPLCADHGARTAGKRGRSKSAAADAEGGRERAAVARLASPHSSRDYAPAAIVPLVDSRPILHTVVAVGTRVVQVAVLNTDDGTWVPESLSITLPGALFADDRRSEHRAAELPGSRTRSRRPRSTGRADRSRNGSVCPFT